LGICVSPFSGTFWGGFFFFSRANDAYAIHAARHKASPSRWARRQPAYRAGQPHHHGASKATEHAARIWRASVRVREAAVRKSSEASRKIACTRCTRGEKAIQPLQQMEPAPDETGFFGGGGSTGFRSTSPSPRIRGAPITTPSAAESLAWGGYVFIFPVNARVECSSWIFTSVWSRSRFEEMPEPPSRPAQAVDDGLHLPHEKTEDHLRGIESRRRDEAAPRRPRPLIQKELPGRLPTRCALPATTGIGHQAGEPRSRHDRP